MARRFLFAHLSDAQLQALLREAEASDWINLLWLVQSERLWQRLADNLTQRTQRHFHESYQHHWQGVRRSQPLAAYWREAYQSFTNLYQLLHVQIGDEAMARLLGITESEAPMATTATPMATKEFRCIAPTYSYC